MKINLFRITSFVFFYLSCLLSFSQGVTVSPISGNTTEDGGTATFTVTLTTEPTASVTLYFSSDDTSEGTVQSSVTIINQNI